MKSSYLNRFACFIFEDELALAVVLAPVELHEQWPLVVFESAIWNAERKWQVSGKERKGKERQKGTNLRSRGARKDCAGLS